MKPVHLMTVAEALEAANRRTLNRQMGRPLDAPPPLTGASTFLPHDRPDPVLPPARQVEAVSAAMDGEACHVEAKLLEGGGLWLLIPGPPRTKKNHGRSFGIKPSVAYVRYRAFIVAEMKPFLAPLGLPLPLRPYNLCARYFVDARGKSADLFGLHQGLADALENAEVIADDWWFRRTDGSDVIPDDPRPRVECTITPLADPASPSPLPTAA